MIGFKLPKMPKIPPPPTLSRDLQEYYEREYSETLRGLSRRRMLGDPLSPQEAIAQLLKAGDEIRRDEYNDVWIVPAYLIEEAKALGVDTRNMRAAPGVVETLPAPDAPRQLDIDEAPPVAAPAMGRRELDL